MTPIYRMQPVADLAYDLLSKHLAEFESYHQAVNTGEDSEAVHQMRVNARRIRALLKAFAPILPRVLVDFGPELKWIAASLGAVRDLDVLIARYPKVAARFSDLRAARLRQLRADLASERYVYLKAELRKWIEERGSPTPLLATTPVLATAPNIVFQAMHAVNKASRSLSKPEQIHALRKKAKQLRYTAEAFAGIYGKPSKRFIASLKTLQDDVGRYQDNIVAQDLFREVRLNGKRMKHVRKDARKRKNELPALLMDLRRRWKPLRSRMNKEWRKAMSG